MEELGGVERREKAVRKEVLMELSDLAVGGGGRDGGDKHRERERAHGRDRTATIGGSLESIVCSDRTSLRSNRPFTD